MNSKKPLPEPLAEAAAIMKRMLQAPPQTHDEMTKKPAKKKSKSRRR
jgi:hypothetical protein